MESAQGLSAADLAPFCSEWRVRPDPALLWRAVRGSACVVWARADDAGPPLGLLTALSDGALTAQVTLLEVLPGWRGRGIGTEQMRRCLARLGGLYAVDLTCDAEMAGFYARLGMAPGTAMLLRHPAALRGPSGGRGPQAAP